MSADTYRIFTPAGRYASPTIECLLCGSTTSLPGDVQQRYCGRCHLFHDAVKTARRLADEGGTHDCAEWQTATFECAICRRDPPILVIA